MMRSKQCRIHIELAPPVEVQVGERLVGFVGANLLNRVVMVGYDVDPAISERRPPFGPCLLILEVTDDAEGGVYPTR
jgi:hypothetical protein